MRNKSNLFVSVIIPVFNDSDRLLTCLQALENQTYPKSHYEVIVVDNASDENIEKLVDQFDQAIVTYESRPGAYVARNKGLTIAKGDVIAFTDADCIPFQNWIENGTENLLSTPDCGLVVGRVNIFFRNPDKPNAVELYDALTAFPNEYCIKVHKFGPTANVFTFRSVIEHVGNFNENLKSAGDLEWGQRVFSSGYKQVYAENTIVTHPARYSMNQLYKKHTRIVGGIYDLKTDNHLSPFQLVKDLVRDIIPPKIAYVRFYSDKRLKGVNRKCKAIFVMLLVKLSRIVEMLRLHTGGKSKRGA
jgi:glycosyltransferase involved in cell wall biosynthesis